MSRPSSDLWRIVRVPCAGEHGGRTSGDHGDGPVTGSWKRTRPTRTTHSQCIAPRGRSLSDFFDSLRFERRMAMRRQASPLVDSSGLLVHGFAVTWRGTRRLIRGHAAHESIHVRLPRSLSKSDGWATHGPRCSCGGTYGCAAPFRESGQRSIDPERRIRAGRCTVSGPSWFTWLACTGQSPGRPRGLPVPGLPHVR